MKIRVYCQASNSVVHEEHPSLRAAAADIRARKDWGLSGPCHAVIELTGPRGGSVRIERIIP